jgi:hypothetical protein
MKRLRNTSGIPDTQVREVIDWIADGLGIAGFDVEVRNSSSTLAGRAYSEGSSYHSTSRPFVVLRVGSEFIKRYVSPDGGHWTGRMKLFPVGTVKVSCPCFPTTISPYQYQQHKGKRYVLANRIEALVYIAAHELRHLWQAAWQSDKRRATSARSLSATRSRSKAASPDTRHCSMAAWYAS